MAEPSEDRLDRLEKKVDKLIGRRASKDSMSKLRLQRQNASLRHQLQQLKLKDMQRNEYVNELEGFLRVQRREEKL